MSQDVAKPTHGQRSAFTADSILEMLPAECNIPGFWETLERNTHDWAPIASVSPIWRQANANIETWKKEYRRESGGVLIKGSKLNDFVGKSGERIKEKILTKLGSCDNKVELAKEIFDQNVPVPRIEDLVRTRLETQFLDGVPFLARKLLELAKSFDANAKIEPKGKISGYFAQHITFSLPMHFRINGSDRSCKVVCEIQVATMLATLVWENSHGLYESSRITNEKTEDWQWNPNDPRFLSRQLGHMIHLADGLFCNLRDKSQNH